ncbi:signal peptide peptidase-domain-containing protein [Biscogniauxia sp. FL1348]|nr:signal peptide peptidase-domain-containing protein [Biscogniauxia sp. FL1348]
MATDNVTFLAVSEIPTTNITGSIWTKDAILDQLSGIPAIILQNRGLMLLEFQIAFTSLACIYIGSYGSLRRPPSARPPKRKKGSKKEQEDQDEPIVQGLLPSDAIVFPILAGTVLVGLYYLIKWLEDPDIINKVLRAYFSLMSLASLGKLFADGLNVIISFVFPAFWRANDGKIYHIDSEKRGQYYIPKDSTDRVWHEQKKTPLPGRFSESKLSNAVNTTLWELRNLFLERWTVRLSVHGIVNEKLKVRFNDILGVVFAIGVNIVYFTTESTMLSNIMGYAFSYAGIMLMSPTTFATGSAVLFGLFFYDIYMVFYTPYMVTVATKLDVPIKIVFEGPNRASMLGLGDIVIPGMFIGLCLRFDHFLYYYRKQKLVPVELKSEDESSGQLITNKEMQRMLVKPEYINPQGQWGNRFWSTTLGSIFSSDVTPELEAVTFAKTYFYAAMFGYLLAIGMTLAMLTVFNHAQPALLYLVPGVVLSVWITGAVRGELREMWMYTEDGSLDKTDVIVEVDGHGDIIKEIQDKTDDDKVGTKKDTTQAPEVAGEKDPSAEKTSEEESKETKKTKPERYPVFLFSIEAPVPDQVP